MEVLLNEHQRLLADSAGRLCGASGGTVHLRALRTTGHYFDNATWRRMAEAGWIGLMVPEAHGGLGLGLVELGLIAVAMGLASVRAPLAATAIAAHAMSCGTCDGALLKSILAGDIIVLPAVHGVGTPFNPIGPLPRAIPAGNRWSLRGDHRAVPDAACAQMLLVAAEAPGGETLLFAVPADAATVIAHAAIDGSSMDDLVFGDTSLAADTLVARGADAEALIAAIRAALTLSVAFELLGVADAAVDLTLSQLKLREQFGRPIGAFQALQHRTVDSFIARELLNALVFRIAAAFDAGTGRPAMIAAAKAKAGRAVLDLVRRALQIHGAMGYAEEHDIGLYYKRALTLSAQYGNEAYHLARFADLTRAEA